MKKPLYRIDQQIVGRTSNTSNLPNQTFLINIDSARYDAEYGHWIYCGTTWHKDDGENHGIVVEMYEYEVSYKLKGVKR